MTFSVVGSGWLGTALGRAVGATPIPRRAFGPHRIKPGSVVLVASGQATMCGHDALASAIRTELEHLREVLDDCERAAALRVIVLGSSDVAGTCDQVTGTSSLAPATTYARVKAALEDECLLRARAGLPLTCVRLAPVHGPGKPRTASLVRLARRRVIPLPSGGRHSIGFVLLADALRAMEWLAWNSAPPVVAVGGGRTPLRDLLAGLAAAQRTQPRFVPVPLPTAALRRMAPLRMPDRLHWLLRLSLPREVAMEVPVRVTPIPEAAAMLVGSC